MACTPKKYKVCSIISVICFVIFLVLAIVLPIVIENFIVSQAKDKALMKASNQNLWGEVPGDSQAKITRKFKFYNFSNPEEFLFENARPVFDEVGDFIYQEYQNFTNYEFVTDNETGLQKINYNFYNYFKHLSGDINQNITGVNLGSMGAWYQFKTSPKKKVALQAMAGIIYTLEDYSILVALSQGLWAQFIKSYDNVVTMIYEPAQNVPSSMYLSLWEDPKYGWGSWITLRKWILASQNGIYSYDAYLLRDYFELSYEQLYALLSGAFQDWVSGVYKFIQDWYCKGQDPCDGKFLAALQLSSQGITMNPPPGTIPATPSVVTTNDTLRGCPEISLYLSEVFLNDSKYNTSEYRNLSFSTEWMMKITNHTPSGSETWLKDEHIILHVGNIDFLFTEGEKFLKSGNISDFENVRKRFLLETNYHAHVFYGWVNYIADEFAMQKSRNGTMDQASIGSFLSLEMVKIYNKANDYLLLEVLSHLMLYNVTKNNISCVDFFIASNLNETAAKNVCSVIPEFNSTWNTAPDSMKTMIQVCWYKRDYNWNLFVNQTNLTNMDVEFICDSSNVPDNRSFGNIKRYSDKRLHDYYECDKVSLTCSQAEFTAKQWGNSSITRNVLPELNHMNKKFINTTTLADWEPQMFSKPWEYYAVIAKYPNFATNNSVVGFNTTVSRKLLTYERFFNQMIRFVVIDYNFNYTKDIERLFQTKDVKALYNYIKYMMITFVFNGFTSTRTVNDLLWGYQDPFIHSIKAGDPQQGGDPSLPDIVSLQNNVTYEKSFNNTQSVFSGQGDINKVRTYKEIYGIKYITFNDTFFNGNDSYVTYTNPWLNETAFGGTDSFGNSPNLDKNSKIYLYVSDLYRGGYGEYKGETAEYNGVQAFRFRLPVSYMQNKELNPSNSPFYMDKWNGLLNLTSVKKLPLMVSTYSHYQLDEDAYKNVDIYLDKNRTILMQPDSQYDTAIDVEPYSGAGLSATLNILGHYEYQSDNLFSNPTYGLLPVFALTRSGHWTDEAIDNQFGLLKLGLKMKLAFQILFYVLAGLFVILCVFMVYKYRKSQKVNKDGTLLPSSAGDIKIDDRVL